MKLVQDIFDRVNRGAVDADFIVQMGACTPAGIAHKPDDIPAFHLLTSLDKDFFQVSVPGHPAVPMVDVYQVAQEPFFRCIGNFSIGRGNDVGAGFVGNIQA